MDVDRALVARDFDFRMQFQRVPAFVELTRFGIEFVNLAQDHGPAILLAHFHRIAFQRRPESDERDHHSSRGGSRTGPFGSRPCAFSERREYPLVIGQLVCRGSASLAMNLLKFARKLKTGNFIVIRFRQTPRGGPRRYRVGGHQASDFPQFC